MANTKQQRKRVRIAQRQRLENLRYKSSIKTHFRRLKDSITAGEADDCCSNGQEADFHHRQGRREECYS